MAEEEEELECIGCEVDGCLSIGSGGGGDEEDSIGELTYHPTLNVLLVVTASSSSTVTVLDVYSGAVLQRSQLCGTSHASSNQDGAAKSRVQCVYIPGHDKLLFTDGQSVGLRRDHKGVLLLDTILQSRVGTSGDVVRIELMLSEAVHLLKSFQELDVLSSEQVDEVRRELEIKIAQKEAQSRLNQKLAKWSTVCLELPHGVLRSACAALVQELRRLNLFVPSLSIASAVGERLSSLLPPPSALNGTPDTSSTTTTAANMVGASSAAPVVDRSLMFSEAARRETFGMWPHMNYKWALPDKMAQAGFYHQSNGTGDDRAMCFTCNICLVCWEPTDEPWSEHERHSPSCPFVKGEYTQNVPLSVTHASGPALQLSNRVVTYRYACVSASSYPDLIATATDTGHVTVWNITKTLKKEFQFSIDDMNVMCHAIEARERRLVTESTVDHEIRRHSKEFCEDKGDAPESYCPINDGFEVTSLAVFGPSDVGSRSPDHASTAAPSCSGDSGSRSMAAVAQRPPFLIVGGRVHGLSRQWVESLSSLSSDSPLVQAKNDVNQSGCSMRSLDIMSLEKDVTTTESCGGGEGGTETEEVAERRDDPMQSTYDPDSPHACPPLYLMVYSLDGRQPMRMQGGGGCTNTSETSVRRLSGTRQDNGGGSGSGCLFNPSLGALLVDDNVLLDPFDGLDTFVHSNSFAKALSESHGGDFQFGVQFNCPLHNQQMQHLGVGGGGHNHLHHHYQVGGVEENGTLGFDDSDEPVPDLESPPPAVRASGSSNVPAPECGGGGGSSMPRAKVVQCVEVRSPLCGYTHRITHVIPTLDSRHLLVVVGGTAATKETSKDSRLLLFGFVAPTTDGVDGAATNELLDERPLLTRDVRERLTTLVALPYEVCDARRDNSPTASSKLEDCRKRREQSKTAPAGYVAAVTSSGRILIIELATLKTVGRMEAPPADAITCLAYCASVERLCVGTSKGRLLFLQLWSKMRESMALPRTDDDEDNVTSTPGPETNRSDDCADKDGGNGPVPRALLVERPLSTEVLAGLHELTQFSNLTPRFSATLPPFWTEIQQEQKQRRHPQHLQQQGEGQQHTRSWRMQSDSSTWDEHLLELALPRSCCIGHVDLKFTLHPLYASPPHIEVTLLRQNTCAGVCKIHDMSSGSGGGGDDHGVDSGIDFGAGLMQGASSRSSSTTTTTTRNPVTTAEFLDAHSANILCGPLTLASHIDLSGQSGIVTFTSPELLKSRARTLLIHIKSLDDDGVGQGTPSSSQNSTRPAAASSSSASLSKPPLGRQTPVKVKDGRQPHPQQYAGGGNPAVPSLQSLLEFYVPPSMSSNSAADILAATSPARARMDPLPGGGCNSLNEISVTVRTATRCANNHLTNEREQRVAMLENTAFQRRLVSAVIGTDSFASSTALEHRQQLALNILNWIAAIQSNGAAARNNLKQTVFAVVHENLEAIMEACFLDGSRTIAHKTSKLIVLCSEFYRSVRNDEEFEENLLSALLGRLPMLTRCRSAGALRWFFLMLDGVRSLDDEQVGRRCLALLVSIVRELDQRSSSLTRLLRARFGLYGNPFELELFDIEAHPPPKPTSTPVTYAAVVGNGGPGANSTGSNNNNNNNNQNGNPASVTSNNVGVSVSIASGGGGMSAPGSGGNSTNGAGTIGGNSLSEDGQWPLASFNSPTQQLQGLLEVEPLHFVCHAASDGTKVEKMEVTGGCVGHSSMPSSAAAASNHTLLANTGGGGNLMTVYVPSSAAGSPYEVSHLSVVLKDIKKTEEELLNVLQQKQSLMMQQTAAASSSSYNGLGNLTSTKYQTSKTSAGLSGAAPSQSSSIKMNQSLPVPGQMSSPSRFQHLLHPPPQQVLVIERMHSGARRFVVLDFGRPIVLTDLIVPSCPDLISLSIDIWCRGEEEDGRRLVVSTDIFFRALVMSDLLPPPVCRYLKVTAIGRYGMSTTRCRIPLGSFYGLSFIPPWVISPGSKPNGPPDAGDGVPSSSSSAECVASSVDSLMVLMEDVRCRYSLACDKLRSLLAPLLSSNQPSSGHVQAFVRGDISPAEEQRVYTAYRDCMQLQEQFNLIFWTVERLSKWSTSSRGDGSSGSNQKDLALDLRNCCTDKLRVLSESILAALLCATCSTSGVDGGKASRVTESPVFELDENTCRLLFRHLATVGSRRFQAMANAFLVRTCGLRPFWGPFVANMLVELYGSEQTAIFPQDRVFLLLVSRHDKSLLRNTLPSVLELLQRLLAPIGGNGDRSLSGVDLPLVGWILLFVSFCLDLAEASNNVGGGSSNISNGLSSEDASDNAYSRLSSENKEREGLSNRWDFIQEEWALLRNQSNQSKMTSSRYYRRKLQKRLMYHKQQLEDLEQTKKEFIPSATFSMLKNHFGNKVAVDLNAAIKQQEQLFKKMLKQHTAKHFKDVVQIRRMDGANLSRVEAAGGASGSSNTAASGQEESSFCESAASSNAFREPPFPLPRVQNLRVARGLASLLLRMDYSCNVDMFLLACKVLARVVTLARPAIGLAEVLGQLELQRLLWRIVGHSNGGTVAAGTSSASAWGGPWAGHAITCLLQDILEGERTFPIVQRNGRQECSSVSRAGAPSSSILKSNPKTVSNLAEAPLDDDPDSHFVSGGGGGANGGGGGAGLVAGLEKLLEVESDETSSDEAPIDCNDSTVASSVAAAASKYALVKKSFSDASKYLIFKSSCGGQGGTSGRVLRDGLHSGGRPSIFTVSSAIDSRLEMGVEIGAELHLKTMAFFEADAFHEALLSPLPPPTDEQPPPARMSLTVEGSPFSILESGSASGASSASSSADMLSICFENLFWQAKVPGVDLECLLQLWVTLNDETSDAATHILPLSGKAAAGLLDALAWFPTFSLRTWCLAFKVLLPPSQTSTSGSDLPVKSITSSEALLPVLVKFLSGTGLEYVSGAKLNVGPNVSGAMCDLLVRLVRHCHSVPSGQRVAVQLKEQLLRIVYLLITNNGAVRCGQGPLDAQCRFVNLLLTTVHLDGLDAHLATSLVEAIASLAHLHVRAGRRATACRSTTESTVSDATCFGGLFSAPIRNDLAGHSTEGTRSGLVHALLSLCVRLVQTPCGGESNEIRLSSLADMTSSAAAGSSSSFTDTFKMEQRSSSPSMDGVKSRSSSSSLPMHASDGGPQTDEHKSSGPQLASVCSHAHALAAHPKRQYVADAVLGHQPTMIWLLSTLAECTGSSMALLLGPVSGTVGPSSIQQDVADRYVLGEPASVGDVVFQLLVTLNAKASDISAVLTPVLAFLAQESHEMDGRPSMAVSLSEPLLWFLVKILDCRHSLSEFLSLGGVEVLCRNLVSSYSSQVNCHPSLLSIIVQKVNRLMAPSKGQQWPGTDNVNGLVNFAPLGTITSKDPTTVQPADILIQPTPPHRRARTPAWSYHFYPEDSWVELTITLPCAVLLHEVHVQPHLTSLATCPSAISLEVSADGISPPKPLCPPRPTAGLTFIRLQLSRPEVTSSVTMRLYRPRDSSNLGLSQILLLGSSAFGEPFAGSRSVPSESCVAGSCIGWLRLLHHCLARQHRRDDPDELDAIVLGTCRVAAGVPGLLQTCCSLLTTPAPELYAGHVESVLLTMGRHRPDVGLHIINVLLHDGGSPFAQGNCSWLIDRPQWGLSSIDSVVDIIHSLCTSRDADTLERMNALLDWLLRTAIRAFDRPSAAAAESDLPSRSASTEEVERGLGGRGGGVPAQAIVHCIAATLWSLAGHADQELLSALDAHDGLLRCLYLWSLQLGADSSVKWVVDGVLTAMCHARHDLFMILLEWTGLAVWPDMPLQDDAPITDDSKREIGIGRLPRSDVDSPVHATTSFPVDRLSTLAAASRSPSAVAQLIRSGLPATLARALLEFCNHHSCVFPEERLTDSDKAGCRSGSSGDGVEASSSSGDGVLSPEQVFSVLSFFTELCSEGGMRDWLAGSEGSVFWLPLMDLLCSPLVLARPNAAVDASINGRPGFGLSAQQRVSIEAATVLFLSRCCWCHPDNQQLLARVLCKIIGKQRSPPTSQGLPCGQPTISGFARRLVLQLLLENERILVCVRSNGLQPMICQPASVGQFRHPRFGCGHRYRLMYASTQTTCADIIAALSGNNTVSMLSMAEPSTRESTDTANKDIVSTVWDALDRLSVAAGVLAKDKRQKGGTTYRYAGNQARGGSASATGAATKTPMQSTVSLSTGNVVLMHELLPESPLPRDVTLAQLLSVLEARGHSLSSPHVMLTLQQQSQTASRSNRVPVHSDSEHPNGTSTGTGASSFPSVLQTFASVGGLALMAQHLPVLYPDVGRVQTAASAGGRSSDEKAAANAAAGLCDLGSNIDADWVKVEGPDDLDEFPELLPLGASTPREALHAAHYAPSMPPHSLACFGLFLRLPGYAETLLRERQKALFLLRLALGVTDDGEGGDIFRSPVAPSLPTLPFLVLEHLFDSTPLTTDDGLLLRRMALDVGAIPLLLACLSILSHQQPAGSSAASDNQQPQQSSSIPQHENTSDEAVPSSTQNESTHGNAAASATVPSMAAASSASKPDDKSHLYWAKGTGFGTGSTTQSWDVEQAILRQKSEEEHVTCLLLVLASFINPGGHVPHHLAVNTTDDDEIWFNKNDRKDDDGMDGDREDDIPKNAEAKSDDEDDDDDEEEEEEEDDDVEESPLLPATFPDLLAQSCLFASISSYLRNDSVLDMARHVPLYRALLRLLRALAVCGQLVSLLLPHAPDRRSDSNISVCCLLTKMKSCVDTYASRLRANSTKGSKSSSTAVSSSATKAAAATVGGRFAQPSTCRTKEEEEESEGLALLIPDIQETARIVKLATERLVMCNDDDDDDDSDERSGNRTCEHRPPGHAQSRSSNVGSRPSSDRTDGVAVDRRFAGQSIQCRYIEVMRRLQFDTFEMIVEDDDDQNGGCTSARFTVPHHFESNMRTASDHGHPSRARRLAQETVTLSTSLPLSYSSSVFVRCDQDRLDLMKVLITGPVETPYANGCFEFDVYFPPDYPHSPMLINLETTGHHTVRFNPNLYNDGKVCLSILNTWHGRPEEKWNSHTSSFLQVLVSIQSLILVQEPYFNEPGYERSRGTPAGQQSSREYDSNIRQATVKWAMLEQLRNPCPCFKEVVNRHFWMKRSEIVEQCETWIGEMETQGRDRRSGRTVALNCQALKRHFTLLKEEFARMKAPAGLEDLDDFGGWSSANKATPESPTTASLNREWTAGRAKAVARAEAASKEEEEEAPVTTEMPSEQPVSESAQPEFAQVTVDAVNDTDSTSSASSTSTSSSTTSTGQENGHHAADVTTAATIDHPQSPTQENGLAAAAAASYLFEPI